ncbi:MAG: hypothetical protein RLY87_1012 [Chloroflexota bacterium]|jgi:uncharacterized alpha-E superfamily protein
MAMLSRVADSLYWMSRYLERAEHSARLLDVTLHQLIDVDASLAQQRWLRLWEALHYDDAGRGSHEPQPVIVRMTADITYADSIMSTLTAARENARQVREHISSEMWEHINRLYLEARTTCHTQQWRTAPSQFYGFIKSGSHLFQGITDATMRHGEGWDYIQIGRAVERTSNTATVLHAHMNTLQAGWRRDRPQHAEWIGLLKMCSAFEAYCKVHTPEVTPQRLCDFLLFDEEFPRSVRFCADTIHAAITRNAQRDRVSSIQPPQRASGQFKASLEYGSMDEQLTQLGSFIQTVRNGCSTIDTAIHQTHISYAVETTILNERA